MEFAQLPSVTSGGSGGGHQLDETIKQMAIEQGLNYSINVLKSARLAVDLCRWHLEHGGSQLSIRDRESLLFWRWSLMIGSPQLQYHHECLFEIDSFSQRSSIKLFELRLLVAVVPGWIALAKLPSIPDVLKLDPSTVTYQSLINRSLVALHTMQSEPALSPEQRDQVLLSLARLFISIQDYYNAHRILNDKLLSSDQKRKDGGIGILSQMGRMFVQMGAMPKAKQCFDKVEYLLSTQYSPHNSSADLTKQHQNAVTIAVSESARHDCVMMNRAVLSIGMGDWTSAVTILSTLIAANPSNGVGLNNLSLALLYTGKLQESVALLETMVYNTDAAVDKHIIFNLITLYDLVSSIIMILSQSFLRC